MKKLILFIIVGLFVFSASTAISQELAANSRPEWSVGIQGGWVIPNKYGLSDTVQPTFPAVDMNATNSLLIGAKAGWTPNFAKQYFTTQLEYFHVFGPNADNQAIFSDGADSLSLKFNATIDAIFLNFILRYPEGKWHPFIGIGPGWAWVKLSDIQTTVTGVGRIDPGKVADRASQFAWQVLVGLEYDITRNWSTDLSYRYYALGKASYDELELDIKGQSINLGINYKF